jgi:hypothetical protein
MVIIFLISLSLMACESITTAPPAESQDTTAAESPVAPAGPVIKVMAPFARASIPNGAVYMRLMTEGDADDRFISAETDVAETVELHETKMDENEVMRMSPIDAVELPAGGSATLEPGGIHVMLMGLQAELATGDTFELTLNFEQSGSQTIEVEVQEGMAMDYSQMDQDQEVEGHAASSAVAMQPQVFKVVAAAYLMDTAGFHAMDDRLNVEDALQGEAGQIEAGDAGVVNRVSRVLAVTDWPEELKFQAEELQTILAQYATALSNDDVEAAKPLAMQAHEAQHGLSHTIESWLSGDSGHGEERQHGETESHEHEEEEGD